MFGKLVAGWLVVVVLAVAASGERPPLSARMEAIRQKFKRQSQPSRQPKPGRRVVLQPNARIMKPKDNRTRTSRSVAPKVQSNMPRVPQTQHSIQTKKPQDKVDLNREPFQSHWHNKQEIVTLIEEAFGEIGSRHKNGLPQSGDMKDFVLRTLNPDNKKISAEENNLVDAAVKFMREEEGLQTDTVSLHHGFLTRGAPLKFFRKLARDLSSMRQQQTQSPSHSVQNASPKRREL